MLKKMIAFAMILSSMLSMAYAHASETTSTRHTLLENANTKVWETIIYPNEKQKLTMHRHDFDRVVIAFNDGILKVTNDQGKSHLLKVSQGHAYYLQRDKPNELHSDENIGEHPLKVIVVEFRGHA